MSSCHGDARSWSGRKRRPNPYRLGADPRVARPFSRGQKRMLSQKEKNEIRRVLEDEQRRLSRTSQNALSYSMNHERNIGRDSIDESMEEEIFSTEMRLHDREKFLLNKVTKQLARLEANEIDVCEECGES